MFSLSNNRRLETEHELYLASTVVLPSEHTLCDYTHWVKLSPGFHLDADKHLKDEVNTDSIRSTVA